jgi:hypothetical protein
MIFQLTTQRIRIIRYYSRTIYVHFIFIKRKEIVQNKYIDRIENWLKSWRLIMAPHKCNYIIFTKKI